MLTDFHGKTSDGGPLQFPAGSVYIRSLVHSIDSCHVVVCLFCVKNARLLMEARMVSTILYIKIVIKNNCFTSVFTLINYKLS